MPNIATGAGNGTAGFSGDNGLATAAELNGPGDVAFDSAGNLYIADTLNDVIRKVTPSGIITTVAGMAGVAGFAGDGGPATAAELAGPNGLAIDPAGNLYIADTNNARIREVSATTGVITTIAGNGTKAVYTATAPEPALTSPLDGPNSIALDASGNVYIADSTSNRCLELLVASQQLILFAGSSNAGGTPAGDNGPATAAKFSGPRAVASDNAGNIYLVDKAHSEVRKVNIATGIITTVAGNATAGFMGDGGLATAAELSAPTGAFVDASGNLYIADTGNQRIRLVSAATGNISTIAGNGTAGFTGDGSAATSAELNTPSGIAVSPVSGQIAIADTTNNVVRVINGLSGSFRSTAVGNSSTPQNISAMTTASVTLQSYQINPAAPADFTMGAISGCTLPGTLSSGTTCTGPVTFTPKAPGLRISQVVAKDSANNQYTFPLEGIGTAPAVGLGPGLTTSYAGTGTAGSSGDGGPAASALLNAPLGLALDAAGDLYIADTANNKVRMVTPSGTISTIAGTGNAGLSGNGGAATAATLNSPSAVAVDPSGNIYIADTANNVIRQISELNQYISSFAGNGSAGYTGDGGAATNATLKNPKGVVSDQLGNLYIADTGNNVIRKVFSGNISTVVAAGLLSAPAGVAMDALGNLYIADTGNNVVRELSSGTVSVIAGSGTSGFSGDGGVATAARLSAPTAVAVDAAGNIYITDSGNNRVRFVSASTDLISTVAGTGTTGNAGNGGGATSSQLTTPSGLSIDQLGRFYIADTGNNRIQKVDATSVTLNFGSVNVNTPSTVQTVVLTNIGNTQLTLSNISVPAGFTQTPSGGTDCSSTTMLAAGAQCSISVTFLPTAKQTYSGSIVITDNALNSTTSTQSIALSGVGTVPSTPTTITIPSGNNQTAAPLAPFASPLKVVVTDQNGVAISKVSVTFTAPATGATGTFTGATNVVIVTTDSTGTATAPTLNASSTRGSFSVTASVAAIPQPAVFTETIAGNPAPQLTVAISPVTNPQTYGNPVQLIVTLTPSSFNGNTPTGTITFLDAGQAVGTASLSSAMASLTIYPSATTTTPHTFSASYSGDANFSASTNSNTVSLSVNPLAITATAVPVTTAYDPSGVPNPTVTLTGTLNGVIASDQGKVSANFTSAGLKFSGTTVTGTNVVGTYPITATLTGGTTGNNSSDYVLTGTTGQVTITKAGSVATLSASSTAPSFGSSVTLTATLTSTTTGTPTGSVSFYNGTALLGSATATNGIATYSTSSLPLGSDSITAVYGGDANFTGTTSPPLVLAVAVPGFTLSATTTSVSVQQGNTAYVPLTLSTVGSFAGTIALSCSGLPANAACVFVPSSYTTSATATSASGIVQIVTSGPGSVIGSNSSPLSGHSLVIFAFLPGFVLAVLFGVRRGGRIPSLMVMLLLGALILGVAPIGCGGSSSNPAATVLTPAGTSTVTITAASGTLSSSASVMLTVTQVR